MKIKIGKYNLSSDTYQYIVSETKVKTSGKGIGQEYESNQTYHPSIESALNNVLQRGLRESKATTLKELLNELQESRRELRAYLKEEV